MFGLGMNTDSFNQDCYRWCSSEAAKKNGSTGNECSFIPGCRECANLCPQNASYAMSACPAKCASGDTACAQNCVDLSKKLQAKWSPPSFPDHFFKSGGKNPFWVPNPDPNSYANVPGSGGATPVSSLVKSSGFTRIMPSGPVASKQSAPASKTWIYVTAAVIVAVGIGAVVWRKKAVPNRRKRRRR